MIQALDRPAESILFFTPYGYWQVHLQLDLAVLLAAKARGLRTTHVTCDAFYRPCAMERGQIDCETCQGSMEQISSLFAVSGEPLSPLMKAEEIALAGAWVEGLDDASLMTATYEDLEVGDWVLSTVMTHFRIGNLADLRQSAVVEFHRRFLRDALLTYWAIGRVIDRDNIETVFLFNGRYYPYRAALEASRQRGLRVLVHERGRIAQSFCFFENDSCLSPKTPDELVVAWADRPLDGGQLEQVDQHFSQLLLGRSPNWPSFYDQIKSNDPHEVLDIPAGAPIVGFFSSSSDEIASQISFAKVSSQFTLIDHIAAILEEAGVYLIVRHHPHIGGGPVGSPVEPSAFFEAYVHTLTRRANVRVVMPKDDLASYAIFPYLKAAIAPFTSLGLEATAFGIPTLVAQGSISRFDARYTIDDWSVPALKQKIAFLLSPDAALDGERLRMFYRTFYSRFHRFSMRFDAVTIADYIQPSVRPDVAERVQAGRDPALDRVMDFLLVGAQVYERPDPNLPSDIAQSNAEAAYVAGRLEVIEDRLKLHGRGVASSPTPSETAKVAILCEEPDELSDVCASLRNLPRASQLSIVPFRAKSPSAWRRALSLSSRLNKKLRFQAWSQGLLSSLSDIEARRVIVVSPRHQLHDASIATILSHARNMNADTGPVATVSGWFSAPQQLRPHRLSGSTLTQEQWRNLTEGHFEELREHDLISLAIIDKEWLRDNLESVDRMQAAFLAETTKAGHLSSSSPIFLWQ